MPELVRSALDINGTTRATSADEYYQRQRLANQSQADEQARLQAMLQDSAANRALQLQTMGSYADRAAQATSAQNAGFAHDTSMEGLRGTNALAAGKQAGDFSLAGIREGNLPEYGRQAEGIRRWDIERQDGAAERESNNLISGMLNDRLRARTQGGGQQPDATRSLFEDIGRAIPSQVGAGPQGASLDLSGGFTPSSAKPTVAGGGDTLVDDLLRAKYGLGSNRPSEQEAYNRDQAKLEHVRGVIQDYKNLAQKADNNEAYASLIQDELNLDKGIMPTFGKPLYQGLLAGNPAARREKADTVSAAYLASPSIQRKIQAAIPSLVQMAQTDPQGIALAVQRATNAFSVEAGKEGADANAIAPAIAKQLATLLAPELEKVEPGMGRRLLAGIAMAATAVGGTPGRVVGDAIGLDTMAYDALNPSASKVASGVLKRANY